MKNGDSAMSKIKASLSKLNFSFHPYVGNDDDDDDDYYYYDNDGDDDNGGDGGDDDGNDGNDDDSNDDCDYAHDDDDDSNDDGNDDDHFGFQIIPDKIKKPDPNVSIRIPKLEIIQERKTKVCNYFQPYSSSCFPIFLVRFDCLKSIIL